MSAEKNIRGITPAVLERRRQRLAVFEGKNLFARQMQIPTADIECLNRAGQLRVVQAMQDASLIPIPEGIKVESFETVSLMELIPQNIQDCCNNGRRKKGWDDTQVREEIVKFLVKTDFICQGLDSVPSDISGKAIVRTGVEKIIRHDSIDREQKPENFFLGRVVTRKDIPSTLGPFEFAPECEIKLSREVITALGELVEENVVAFSQLVGANSEEDQTAYSHSVRTINDCVSEPFFQVDIAGLPEALLLQSNIGNVKDILRGRIFEFEPSIAMYGLIETFGGGGTLGTMFREHLELIRQKTGLPIVLLAPTLQKFTTIRETEFGKSGEETLLPDEVKTISGFDDLWGPKEFMANKIDCTFFVRPSDPISKLIDPTVKVDGSLLSDPENRRIIRQQAITLNIDDPNWSIGDPRRIKDSKAALPAMGMGFEATTIETLLTDKFAKFMNSQKLTPLSSLRAKPTQGVFGGYGQKTITLFDDSDRHWLKASIGLRGPYILQPEIKPLVVKDNASGNTFVAMDRIFFSMVTGKAEFMGGIRILIPSESQEAKHNRLHGTSEMISAPITGG